MRVLTGYEQEAMELTTQESEAEYNRERYAAEFTEVTLYCNCGATKTVKLRVLAWGLAVWLIASVAAAQTPETVDTD